MRNPNSTMMEVWTQAHDNLKALKKWEHRTMKDELLIITEYYMEQKGYSAKFMKESLIAGDSLIKKTYPCGWYARFPYEYAFGKLILGGDQIT
jgi:hypothetical protein